METKPIAPFKCDKCKIEFEPMHGGKCIVCNRLLCHKHLIGHGIINIRKDNNQPICPDCYKTINKIKEV